MATVGRNPGRILSVWDDFVGSPNGNGHGFCGIGEPIWPGRSPDEVIECEIHERLLNLAFRDFGALHLVCPYDTTGLSSDVVARATTPTRATIPIPMARCTSFLRPPARGARRARSTADGVRGVRREITELARHVGLNAARTDDLVLAVNEVATNSVRHGGGGGTLRAWIDGEAVVCEITDGGRDHRSARRPTPARR